MTGERESENSERELRRSVLGDAMATLGSATDKRRAADEVLRALDHYLEVDTIAAGTDAARARGELAGALGSDGGPTRGEGMAGALTRYLRAAPRRGKSIREPLVTNFEHPPGSDVRWARWIVLALAAIASTTVAFTFSEGFIAGGLVLAIWVMALLALSFA
jgi:hypothetical protein